MKDALGHGSNGGYANIDKNTRGPGKHTGYAVNGAWQISKTNGAKSDWYQAVHPSGEVMTGKGLGTISRQLDAYSDMRRAGGQAMLRAAESGAGSAHVDSIARAHGIPTGHLR